MGPGRSDRRYHGGACRKKGFLRRQRERAAPELSPPEPTHALDREGILAEATSEVRLVAYLAKAAAANWRASAWLLERRYPERWAARGREVELAAPGEGDPFREVDELAVRRRQHLGRD